MVFVNGSRAGEVGRAVTPTTALVWLEVSTGDILAHLAQVCTNPGLHILDLAAVTAAVRAESRSAVIAVDNTFLTPWVDAPPIHQFHVGGEAPRVWCGPGDALLHQVHQRPL